MRMRQPRCGMQDKDKPLQRERRRKKRYTLQGSKWNKKVGYDEAYLLTLKTLLLNLKSAITNLLNANLFPVLC